MTFVTRADEIATEFQAPADERIVSDEGRAGHEAAQNGAAPEHTQNGRHQRHKLELDPSAVSLGAAGSVGAGEARPEAAESTDAAPAEPSDATADATARVTETETDEVVQADRHETLPDIARHAAGVWLRAAGWTAGTSLRVGNELRKIATDPNAAQEAIEEVTKEVREVARDFLGINELDAEVQQMAPLLSTGLLKAGGSSPEALRAQGEQLLRDAADVGFDEGAHPAFARILAELSPDEARILRLLAIEGAQPMVDIRAHNLIGNGSQLIAQSLNMLGPKAGLRQRKRVPVYLTNLVRCNLIVLADDPLESPMQYQVLEAQPEVLSTTRDTIRAKIIRRSVYLSPLGQEFCDVCLPVGLPGLPPPSEA